MSDKNTIVFDHVEKTYQKNTVIRDLNLTIPAGQRLILLGPSGCGKSTTLRMIAGLEEITGGELRMGGRRVNEVPSGKRDIAMVFQNYALYPHMTVRENITYALRVHKLDRAELETRLHSVLEILGLEPYVQRKPRELSGGQRQRVGIARALAVEPRLVVCDEPVSALDVSVQAQMLNLLLDLQADEGLTYVLVSHDLSVVRHSAGRVCVMFLGRVCEIGPTEEVFTAPRHPYTKLLLAAVPRPDPTRRNENGPPLAGEIPSPVTPPSGCRFRTRCPYAQARCAQEVPKLQTEGARGVACHFPLR